MTRELTLASMLVGMLAASGCAEPVHLTYDYARAYEQAFSQQADLSRPSVAEMAYPLAGQEAITIRMRVEEAATDTETEETTLESD